MRLFFVSLLVTLFGLPAMAEKTKLDLVSLSPAMMAILSLHEEFKGGMHQGTQYYYANLECSNPTSIIDDDRSEPTCSLQQWIGFSRNLLAPVPLPKELSKQIVVKVLSHSQKANFFRAGNAFKVIGGMADCSALMSDKNPLSTVQCNLVSD